MVKVFSFDCDETLEISRGPIPISDLRKLHDIGHIVGIVGNWGLVLQQVPDWHRFINFISLTINVTDLQGNVYGDKAWYLREFKNYVRADAYYHIGNRFGALNKLGVVCGSDDEGNCARAGYPWKFVKEDDWKLEDYI